MRDERTRGRAAPPAAFYRFSLDREGIRPAEDLATWLRVQLKKVSAKSDLAKAIHHPLTRLPQLEVYLSSGRLEIENNVAERSISGLAIGRKN